MTLLHRVLLLVMLSLLPLAGLEVFNALRLRDQAARDVEREVQRLMSLAEGEQERLIEGVRNLLATLRQTRAVRDGDVSACETLMRRLRGEYPRYLEVHVTGTDGRVRCSTDAAAVAGLDISDRLHVRSALMGEDFAVGRYIVSRVSGRPILPFGMPVRDDDGRIVGAVTAVLDADWLAGYLARRPLPRNASIAVADADGVLVARVPALPGVIGTMLPPEYLQLLANPAGGVQTLPGLDGRRRVIAISAMNRGVQGLIFVVGIDRDEALAPVNRWLAMALSMLMLAILTTVTVSLRLGRRYLHAPVAELTAAVRRWRDGDLSARAAVRPDAVEIAGLADAFNAMADALADRGRALRDSEARHRAIFETAVDSLVVIDEHGIVQSLNPAAERTFGYEAEELVGRNVSVLVPDHERPQQAGQIRDDPLRDDPRTARKGIGGSLRLVDGQRRDGSRFPMELSITEWRDAEGRRFFTGIMRDISGRLEAAQALREAEERYRLAARATNDTIWDWDIVADTVQRSAAAAGLTGVTPDEIEATTGWWLDRIHSGDRERVRTDLRRLLDGAGQHWTAEYRIVRTDGSLSSVLDRGYVIRDRKGRPVRMIGAVTDLTDRMRSEAALKQAKDLAERADQAKSKFLAAASHDLRQPMQGAMLLAAALERHLPPTGPGRGVLEHLERSLNVMKELLDGLLDISKLDAGAVTALPHPVALDEVLSEIDATHGPVARAKGLEWQVDTGTGLIVRSDPALLGRMVRNLVENAIRYTPEGGRITLSCERIGMRVRLAVRDTGIGIPKDRQKDVYEEFVQVANEGRDRAQGLGLGLAIVRRLSRLLEHPVSLDSEPGQGSEFTIAIPLAGAVNAPPAAVAADTAVVPGEGRTVLLIEDDAVVAMGLQVMLEEWGYRVLAAPALDGATALLDAADAPPDAVVTDYRLQHGKVGTDAVRALRDRFGLTLPGVLLTGETAAVALVAAAELGLVVVHKPVQARQLRSTLARVTGDDRHRARARA